MPFARLASEIQSGAISPADVDEPTIAEHLYTAGAPDPDLLVRTAGEMRISNFLAVADQLRRDLGNGKMLAGV